MKINDYIERLETLIEELKELQEIDPDVPCEMYVNVPHACCGCCSGGYCYCEGDNVELASFSIERVMFKDKKTKSQILQKIKIRGD